MRRTALSTLKDVFGDNPLRVRANIIAMYAILAVLNIGTWLLALSLFRDQPVLLGTVLLAYGFGLRHAVDADHIAAIDNVTRKLMQEGKRPVSVGFFFAFGHSTVVILATAAIALTATAIHAQFPQFKEVGGVIGTSVSALFLLAIGVVNLIVFVEIWRAFRRVRRGGSYSEEAVNELLCKRGFFARIFRPLFRLIGKSWHMYPLGFLFGLGFDTASEIALFGMSATQAAQGLPLWSILIFPALFVAAMALVDTTDGILMLGAYGWAFVKPIRKLYYNMTITFASVVVALLVGGIEALGLIGDKLALQGGVWDLAGSLSDEFGLLGYIIIGVFAGSWLVSTLVYRLKRYGEIELAGQRG
jgi:nickel/cobalt transporter (NiCoT) family protein